MREDNDRMNVITRSESDDAMENLVTKEDLQAGLADTKNDILAGIDQRLTKAWLDEREFTKRRITEAKLEIVAVNKKNIADAIAPVNSRLDLMDARLDQVGDRLERMDGRFDRMDGRFDRMDDELRKLGEGQGAIAEDVATIAKFAQAVLDEHENRLKDAKL